jgi:hypothetical protein
MARTTITLVTNIISTSLDDNIVESYIDSANVLVTDLVGSDTDMPSDLKAEIERWLTAHMIASTVERMGRKEGAGGAYIEYIGKDGELLKGTPYGQMVLLLDTSGAFAAHGGGKQRANMTIL